MTELRLALGNTEIKALNTLISKHGKVASVEWFKNSVQVAFADGHKRTMRRTWLG